LIRLVLCKFETLEGVLRKDERDAVQREVVIFGRKIRESRTLFDGFVDLGKRDRVEETLEAGRLGSGDLLRHGSWRGRSIGGRSDNGLGGLFVRIASLADSVTDDLGDIRHFV